MACLALALAACSDREPENSDAFATSGAALTAPICPARGSGRAGALAFAAACGPEKTGLACDETFTVRFAGVTRRKDHARFQYEVCGAEDPRLVRAPIHTVVISLEPLLGCTTATLADLFTGCEVSETTGKELCGVAQPKARVLMNGVYFHRLALGPGQCRTVSFELGERALPPDLRYDVGAGFAGGWNTDQDISLPKAPVPGYACVSAPVCAPRPVPVVARDDSFALDEDTSLEVAAPGVTANDDGTNGAVVSLVEPPAQGMLLLRSDGSFRYTPPLHLALQQSFTYLLTAGEQERQARVTLLVRALNDVPVALPDRFLGREDETLEVLSGTGILANDRDADGDLLTAHLVQPPAFGQVVLQPDGTFVYTPDANFHGSDQFVYEARDASASSTSTEVVLEIAASNDPPVLGPLVFELEEDHPLTVSVGAGLRRAVTDPDSTSFTFEVVSPPSRGTLNFAPNGAFEYLPALNTSGAVIFSARVSDGSSWSLPATVRLEIGAVNDAPVAVGDVYGTHEDTTLVVPVSRGVLGNDSDVETASLLARVVQAPIGTLSLASDGSFTYRAPADRGDFTDSFEYVASDGELDSNRATVSIRVHAVNDAPTALARTFTFDEDERFVLPAPGLLLGATDSEEDPLAAVLETAPAGGVLRLSRDGSLSYQPPRDFHGSQTWTFRASDGHDESAPVAIRFEIQPVNDPPQILSFPPTGSISDGQRYEYAVAARDAEGPVLFGLQNAPAGMAIDNSGLLRWTPAVTQAGLHDFRVRVTDGAGERTEQSISILVSLTPRGPIITSDPPRAALISGLAGAAEPIRFDDWTEVFLEGAPRPGVWTVSEAGQRVVFNERLNPSLFVSDFELVDGLVSGDFMIGGSNTRYVGFVFGYQDEQNAHRITWKASREVRVGEVAEIGLALHEAVDSLLSFWGTYPTNLPGVTNLWTQRDDAPPGTPYARQTHYRFELESHRGEYRFTISEGATGAVVAEHRGFDPEYRGGRFGFYSNAQQGYTNYNYSLQPLRGRRYAYDVTATHPTGETLSYALLDAPPRMTISSSTGAVRWVPTSQDRGVHPVQIQVSDSSGRRTTQSFELTVSADAPVITSAPVTHAAESEEYVYALSAVAPEAGATITYSSSTAPSGMTIGSASGVVRWSPTAAQVGTRTVIFRATDSAGRIGRQRVQIEVAENGAPQIRSSPVRQVAERTDYEYEVDAVDPEGEALRFTLPVAPNGMTLSSSGLLAFRPTPAQVGLHPVTVSVEDARGKTATQSFELTVSDVNEAPVISSVPAASVLRGNEYTYQVQATDPDAGDVLAYSLAGGPEGMSVSETGRVRWTPRPEQSGSTEVRLRVIDAAGLSVLQAFSVEILEALPTFALSASIPQFVSEAPVREAGLAVLTPSAFEVLRSPRALELTVNRRGPVPYRYTLSRIAGGRSVLTGQGVLHSARERVALIPADRLPNGMYRLSVEALGETESVVFSIDVPRSAAPVEALVLREAENTLRLVRFPGLFGAAPIPREQAATIEFSTPLDRGWSDLGQRRRVEVRLSEAEVYRFDVALSDGELRFAPVDGAGKLERIANEPLSVLGDRLVDPRGESATEGGFRLLTADGERDFDLVDGLVRVRTAEGEVFVTPEGLFHASGATILLERDTRGQVVGAEASDGRRIELRLGTNAGEPRPNEHD